eukprot:scaffold214036_cov30-Tisochrysis_lutea.AAC.1
MHPCVAAARRRWAKEALLPMYARERVLQGSARRHTDAEHIRRAHCTCQPAASTSNERVSITACVHHTIWLRAQEVLSIVPSRCGGARRRWGQVAAGMRVSVDSRRRLGAIDGPLAAGHMSLPCECRKCALAMGTWQETVVCNSTFVHTTRYRRSAVDLALRASRRAAPLIETSSCAGVVPRATDSAPSSQRALSTLRGRVADGAASLEATRHPQSQTPRGESCTSARPLFDRPAPAVALASPCGARAGWCAASRPAWRLRCVSRCTGALRCGRAQICAHRLHMGRARPRRLAGSPSWVAAQLPTGRPVLSAWPEAPREHTCACAARVHRRAAACRIQGTGGAHASA